MTGSIATICRAGAGATAGGSDRAGYSYGHREKPLESGGFSPFGAVAEGRENFLSLAGQWGGALLNDAPRKGFPGTGSGRIAQLVEQLTLNQRVPGSSPGAPTKLFERLALIGIAGRLARSVETEPRHRWMAGRIQLYLAEIGMSVCFFLASADFGSVTVSTPLL